MKFQVFKNGKLDEDFVLSAAYMFGADTIPLYTTDRINFKKGVIECKKKSPESAGLALLWPVEGFGKVLLPTTRLPDRKKPYNLNVELARARLMQGTLKREDWSLFEESNSFADLAHEAQALFIEALQNVSNPPLASTIADESLKKALAFSEQLAAKHAEQFLLIRCKNRGLGRHSLGCTINPELLEKEDYRKRLFDMFGFVTVPMSWAQIEPEKDRYDYSVVDRCIELLAGRRLALCAGPVLCFSKEHVPAWLLKKKWEFERIREKAYDFVSRVVTKYSRYIHTWRLINGVNAMNHFRFNFEQIIEITRTACLAARSADTKSRKLVEIAMPWGEYYAYDRETIPPLVYADMVIQSGINFDAFAMLLHFGKNQPGMHIRDMMQISSRLDCFAPIAKPLHITGVAVPGGNGTGKYDCELAGFWHKQWDQDQQSEWLEQLYRIALGKPFINSITYSHLTDAEKTTVLNGGLLDKKLAPKKAFVTLTKLQKMILNKENH